MDLPWKQGRLHGLCLKSREGGLKETPQDGPEVLGHRQWVQAVNSKSRRWVAA